MISPLTRALLALLVTGALAACDTTPVRTMWALRNVDPMVTEPGGIRLAVRVPQSFRPSPDGITLTGILKATQTQAAETTVFTIKRDDGAALPAWMRRAGAPLYGYRLSDADIDRFRAYQRKAALAKASKRGGEISIGTEVCRLSRDIPEQVLVSVFIKTAEIDDYVALFEDKNILDEASKDDIAEQVPLCN